METVLNFIVDHYIWFLIISIICIFGIIGYFVDRKRKKDNPYKIQNTNYNEEINLDNIEMDKSLSLQSVVSKNKSINNGENTGNSN